MSIDHYWEDENYEPDPETLIAAAAALIRIRKRQSMLKELKRTLDGLNLGEWLWIIVCMSIVGFSVGTIIRWAVQ